MRDDTGDHGEPIFYGSGKPDDAADLTEVAAYAAKVGNVKVGTGSQRNALSGNDLWNGLRWIDEDEGTESIWYTTGGWQMFPLVTDIQTSGFLSAVSGFTIVKQNWIPIGGRFMQLYFTVQRANGAADVVPGSDGNITNITVAQGNVGFRPAMPTPMASGSEGRTASFVYNTNGQLRLAAVANTVHVQAGDQLSGGGLFAVQD